MALTPAEQASIDAYVSGGGKVTVCPRINPLSVLSMAPKKQPGRGNNGRYRRGARTMLDAVSLVDPEELP